MSKVCDICENPLNIQIEYNLKDYEVVFKEICLHCGVIINSTLDITKQDIDFHVEQILNKNICAICNKDVTIDNISICKKGLVVFVYIKCLHCKAHYIIIKPCDIKELEQFNTQLSNSKIEYREVANVIVKNII